MQRGTSRGTPLCGTEPRRAFGKAAVDFEPARINPSLKELSAYMPPNHRVNVPGGSTKEEYIACRFGTQTKNHTPCDVRVTPKLRKQLVYDSKTKKNKERTIVIMLTFFFFCCGSSSAFVVIRFCFW